MDSSEQPKTEIEESDFERLVCADDVVRVLLPEKEYAELKAKADALDRLEAEKIQIEYHKFGHPDNGGSYWMAITPPDSEGRAVCTTEDNLLKAIQNLPMTIDN